MPEFPAVGLFCEDIREEKSGQFTLVGLLPDSINVPSVPGMLPKLCLYVRVHINPPEADPGPISARILMPDGSELVRNDVKPDSVNNARERAVAKGTPVVGIILRFTAMPLPVATEGRILAEVTIGQRTSICGSLAINVKPTTSGTTAS